MAVWLSMLRYPGSSEHCETPHAHLFDSHQVFHNIQSCLYMDISLVESVGPPVQKGAAASDPALYDLISQGAACPSDVFLQAEDAVK